MIAPSSCPHCGSRLNPGPVVDTYAAWMTRLGRTDRALAEEAAAWFRAEYPDSDAVIAQRRAALNREALQLHAPGLKTARAAKRRGKAA